MEIKQKEKKLSWQMFNSIAEKYDFTNRLLSFGIDIHWRKKLIPLFPKKNQLRYLDLATGTGDVLITILSGLKSKVHNATGIDMAEKMIEIGNAKITKKNLNHIAKLKVGDATNLDLPNNSYDTVTIAFGIRNLESFNKGLEEMFRVLDTNGRLLVLEFSFPKNKLFKNIYHFYLKNILPFLGGLVSGNFKAYRYLNKTIEQFPYGEAFTNHMKAAGFKNLKRHPLCFGIATIYQGDKIVG